MIYITDFSKSTRDLVLSLFGASNSEHFFLQKKHGQNSFETEVKTGVCLAPVLFVFCLCFVNSECPYCYYPYGPWLQMWLWLSWEALIVYKGEELSELKKE